MPGMLTSSSTSSGRSLAEFPGLLRRSRPPPPYILRDSVVRITRRICGSSSTTRMVADSLRARAVLRSVGKRKGKHGSLA